MLSSELSASHNHPSGIIITNRVIAKMSEMPRELQNLSQRYPVTKCFWKNSINGLALNGVAINFEFVKTKQTKNRKTQFL